MAALMLSALVLALSLFTSCTGPGAANRQAISRTAFYFNTIIEIRIYDKGADEELLDGCMELCHHYEQMLSAHIGGTDIARINAAAGEPVSVDAECAELIAATLPYTAITGGAFNITIGGVSVLWNFTGDPAGPVPEIRDIEEALTHVGADLVTVRRADASILSGGSDPANDDSPADSNVVHGAGSALVTLADPATRLDAGAFAKGYVADRLRDYLKSHGVTSALINLGGNVLAIGENPDGTPFTVGIRDPHAASGSYELVAEIRDRSIVTSGDYERYFEEDGVRYHHILDARTGFPADTGLSAVTVVCEDSYTADILSTVLFLMGAKDGLIYAEDLPFAEALFITTDGEVLTTAGFPLR